jgi:prolyl-tRNA synthetase
LHFTTTVEAFIPSNGRGIQGATSHHLGQNFSKMFDIWFETTPGNKEFVHQTSWGLTTRTIGVMVMVHGDDKGLVLPPRVAPVQVALIPILGKNDEAILARVKEIETELKGYGVRTTIDDRTNYNPGWKFNYWEQKGVPLRVEVGPKDLQNSTIRVVRRVDYQAQSLAWSDLSTLPAMLEEIQATMLEKATRALNSHIVKAGTWEDFMSGLNGKNLVLTPWCQGVECEEQGKKRSHDESVASEGEHLTGAAKTLCMPFQQDPIAEGEVCFQCGEVATRRALWGRSY